jgi:hypothetical protein
VKTFRLTNQALRDYLEQRCGLPRPADGKLHLIGIRGARPTPEGDRFELQPNVPDEYNDAIGVFGTQFFLHRGSVDPGSAYTLHPMNPDGCAHLLNGAWPYQFGSHHGHPALVQAGPVKVWRDRDRDYMRDVHEGVYTGDFAIHIHAGGAERSVGPNSAGCQVLWGGWGGGPWNAFYGACQASGQQRFTYYLVDGAALAEFCEL